MSVVFDNSLTFDKHISAICKLAFYHLRGIAKIRSYLWEESTIALIHAFISCRLDNGNALYTDYQNTRFRGYSLYRPRRARLVNRRPKFGHTSPLLFELH